MGPITDVITRELTEALERSDDLDRRGLQSVTDEEVVDVHTVLAVAIQSAPIDSPYQPHVDQLNAGVDLCLQVKHLSNVARALLGFRHGGTVQADPAPLHFKGRKQYGLFQVHVTWPVQGWVTYIHILKREFKKAGKTGIDPETGKGLTFEERMDGSYNCIRKVIADGPPYLGDPWKRNGPFTILAGHEVTLWAKEQPTHQAAMDEEDILNEFFRGEWSKEGWKKKSMRRPRWPTELHRKRARVDR